MSIANYTPLHQRERVLVQGRYSQITCVLHTMKSRALSMGRSPYPSRSIGFTHRKFTLLGLYFTLSGIHRPLDNNLLHSVRLIPILHRKAPFQYRTRCRQLSALTIHLITRRINYINLNLNFRILKSFGLLGFS